MHQLRVPLLSPLSWTVPGWTQGMTAVMRHGRGTTLYEMPDSQVAMQYFSMFWRAWWYVLCGWQVWVLKWYANGRCLPYHLVLRGWKDYGAGELRWHAALHAFHDEGLVCCSGDEKAARNEGRMLCPAQIARD